ncbi:MAG: hypothetical protein HYZ37_09020 [Candidatus Solibacter usitatus]|nr:hypothetical protein [Candidatus Solibacter usitatus]
MIRTLALLSVLAFQAREAWAQKLEIVSPMFHQYEDSPPLRGEVSYFAGETVYFSGRVAGFKANAKDMVNVQWTAEVFDEAGVALVKAETKTVEEELAPEDKDWKPKIVFQFDTPPTALCAACRVVVRAKDTIGQTEARLETRFALRGRLVEPSPTLTIRNMRFLRTEEDGAPLEPVVYKAGEELWGRFEIVGFKYGAGTQLGVEYGLTVFRPSGKQLYQEPTAAAITDKDFYAKRYVSGILNLRMQGLPAGEYTIVVEVRDKIGDQKYEGKYTFRIE